MLPFTRDTLKVFGILLLIGIAFYFLNFSFHPIVNIILKSVLMTMIYVGILYPI